MSNIATPVVSAQKAQLFLQTHPTVKYIRAQWVDFSGILRAIAIPKERYLELATLNKPLKTAPLTLNALLDDSLVEDHQMSGLHQLVPDPASLMLLGPKGKAEYASVMCYIIDTGIGRTDPAFEFCPRQTLANVLQKADTKGIKCLVGFEIEFMILKASNEGAIIPYSSHPAFFAVAGWREPAFHCVQECVDELAAAGVGIYSFQVEGRVGQYEIALKPRSPIEAVDELIQACDMIKTIVARHGYIATMMPKPVPSRPANGMHMHVSINPLRREEHFLAGILQRLPAICAFGMPYQASYSRLGRGEAGTVVGWGTEDRAGAVRKIDPGHWEFRTFDATANMYLAVAAVLCSGLLGMHSQEPLRWNDSADISMGPENFSADPLPQGLESSLSQLEIHSKDLEDVFGQKSIARYVATKRTEATRLEQYDENELRAMFAKHF